MQVYIRNLDLNLDQEEELKTLLGISEFEYQNFKRNLPAHVSTVGSKEEADKLIESLKNLGVPAYSQKPEGESGSSEFTLDGMTFSLDAEEEPAAPAPVPAPVSSQQQVTTPEKVITSIESDEEPIEEKTLPSGSVLKEDPNQHPAQPLKEIFAGRPAAQANQSVLRKRSIPYLAEVLVALTFIAIFIGLFKLIIDKDAIDSERQAYTEYVDTVFDVAKNKHTEVLKPKEIKREDVILTYTINDSRNAVGSFQVINDAVSTYNLIFTGEAPPPLTDLEIVENKKQAPWLKKVVFSNMSINNNEKSFFIEGLAKIVIIKDDKPVLINSSAIISGEIQSNDNLVINVLVNKGFEKLPTEDFIFENIDETSSRVFIRKVLALSANQSEESVRSVEQKIAELAD